MVYYSRKIRDLYFLPVPALDAVVNGVIKYPTYMRCGIIPPCYQRIRVNVVCDLPEGLPCCELLKDPLNGCGIRGNYYQPLRRRVVIVPDRVMPAPFIPPTFYSFVSAILPET